MAAANVPTAKLINGAASATLATAISNFNTAMATFLANAAGAIWNPNTVPTIQQMSVVVAPDAAVANDQYMAYAGVMYIAT